jgi:hypothetical protein
MDINTLIKGDLPFLDLSNTTVLNKVDTAKWSSFYSLQPYLLKSDTEVEDETKYTNLEKILVAAYTAYQLLFTKAITTLAGDAETGESSNNKLLTKAKADVVEAEFSPIKSADGANISLTGEKLMANLKKKVCDTAMSLNIVLPLCEDCSVFTPQPYFVVVK